MYYQENNIIKVFNYLLDLKYILKTSDEDEITNFGYNYIIDLIIIFIQPLYQ